MTAPANPDLLHDYALLRIDMAVYLHLVIHGKRLQRSAMHTHLFSKCHRFVAE